MQQRIYSAGPSITDKEVEYAAKAARYGWYSRYDEWVKKFERAFADYIGVRFAWATPCGTAALHLAMSALRLKEGDEVIIPDLSWVATADVVIYTGAKPVFVDIDPDTWTMNPDCFKAAITPKTRAVMPVHMYGHPAEMDAINTIAHDHDLTVVEDACPSVGSEYKNRKTGGLGDIGCFSFQGAKMLATGEGGMFVTDNEEYYERAKLLAEHGRDDSVMVFWSSEVGYQYTMANVVAAIGVAQLERVDELVMMKRRIFDWYAERLDGIKGIKMFKEKEECFSNCSYPSILLDENLAVGRDELRVKLKKRNIDTRPTFTRMSIFPAFEAADTPVAKQVESQGLNLPCAFSLTEEDVEYVVGTIRGILGV